MEYIGFQKELRVSYPQVDGAQCMTPAALLSALEETAIEHSDSLGYTIDTMRERGWFWSVVNWHLQIHRIPRYGETILSQTWNDKFSRFQANRSFSVYDAAGNRLLDGMSRWIFMDIAKRKPANVPPEMAESYHSEQAAAIPDEKFFMPKEPQGAHFSTRELTVTRRDTDTNAHANNVKYLEWVMDDIPDEIYHGMMLCDIRIVYRKECRRGDMVTVKTYLSDTAAGKCAEAFLYAEDALIAQVITLWAERGSEKESDKK